MKRVSVEVPPELVRPIRETVLLLYQATAESLHLALRAHSERQGSLEEVRRHRARLAELDALLGRLGWRAGSVAGPLELSSRRDLLHDTLYGALIDAGERLAAASNRCWRGELPLERVQEAAREVLALEELVRALESLPERIRTTSDHDEIRRWVEQRGGTPARVRGTGDGDDVGLLRIDLPGGAEADRLERISWDEWFEKFDENELAFLYQEQETGGADSTLFKLVRGDSD